MAKNSTGWIFLLQNDHVSPSTHPCSINEIWEIYHGIWGYKSYIDLMSFKYNIASIYMFILPWQHHITAGHLGLIVLKFDFNLSVIHEAVM